VNSNATSGVIVRGRAWMLLVKKYEKCPVRDKIFIATAILPDFKSPVGTRYKK
jgi:hypothetical protein